ncbi:hypothetical protein CANINC_004440 [Pichia inconspicua]|uniref:Protein arginine methyltransferase NDUFAF7 n=1 Tax=Pichia inconspicua TaxID=52247 RepID=A0A4T0WVR9_9ASCO|nr:hypothetical protein CANINC_004440 [[Candida] inconspicua]
MIGYWTRKSALQLPAKGILRHARRSVASGTNGKHADHKEIIKGPKPSAILGPDGKPITVPDNSFVMNKRERMEPLDATLSNTENLTRILKNMIKTTGPISISHFMKQCLIDPQYGYYTTRNPLDSKTGDFITSPEISSTFGEMCSLWFFSAFIEQLKYQAATNRDNFDIQTKKFRIIEFGPGKGTLMFDMVRTIRKFVKDSNPIEIVFIEKSEVLIKEQHKTMCNEDEELKMIDSFTFESVSKWGNKITWLKDDKPQLSGKEYMNFIMAHEFFDALPMNRFVKTEKGWREYLVDIRPDAKKDSLLTGNVDTKTKKTDAEFVIVQAPYATPQTAIPKTSDRYESLPVGSEVEISAESHSYIYEFSSILKSSDIGAGLIIDYGTTTIPINSLRGIKDHKFVNPLGDVGEVDLSIDVDFGSLAEILKQNQFVTHVAEQGDFLNNMGLGYRMDQLISSNEDKTEIKEKLIAAYKRLTGKGIRDMGKIYKVLGFYPSTYEKVTIAGFEKQDKK